METVRLVALLCISGLMLAGCTETPNEEAPVDFTDPDEVHLAAGKGAIAGLVLDDRFRPVADASILLLPVGLQAVTTINGEFTFIDLEPGEYTVRATAEQHEAKSEKATVVAGEFAETTVLARRVVDEGSFVITQEYAAFIPCAFQIMVETVVGDCTLDQSGDSSRIRYHTDLTAFGNNLTHVVTEMLASHVGGYGLQIMWGDVDLSANYGYYAVIDAYDTNYAKIVLSMNESREDTVEFGGIGLAMDPWLNDRPFHTTVFLYGEGSEELRGVAPGMYPFTGIGVDMGVKSQFMVSAFVGEPDEPVADYCILC